MLFLDVYNILQNIPFYIATLRIHVLKAAIPPRTVFEIDVQSLATLYDRFIHVSLPTVTIKKNYKNRPVESEFQNSY